jgi:aspartyl-tRNA(Asn)/glutamyl-tRNA(Gln) amidotransferase subunit A
MLTGNDPAFPTVRQMAIDLRAGRTTPTRLAQEALRRLGEDGVRLNAVVTITGDLALRDAARAEAELAAGHDRGPLHGIPYGAKDLLSAAGIPTSWGAAPLRNQVFDHDATVVERLREAGAVLVGKLAMVELAGGFGYDQPNAALTGPGRNAWDPERWAGGSSSGSGAAVAIGAVPFAIGSETWGSITTPAAFNGITGLRPTYGRVSRHGAMALSWTMDKIGPMALTADDCAVVLEAIAGQDPNDPTTSGRPAGLDMEPPSGAFRFAALRAATTAVSPMVAQNYEASLQVLRTLGTVEEVELPDLPYDAAATMIITCEAASAFEEFLQDGLANGLTAPEDRVSLYAGLSVPAVDYLRALRLRRRASRAVGAVVARYDAIVAPTLALVATPIDADFTAAFHGERGPSLGAAGNLCGLPAITVPNGLGEDGLPTGLEFLGRAFDERTILAAARAFQATTDFHQAHPAVSPFTAA